MTQERFIERAEILGMEVRRAADLAACRLLVAEIVGARTSLVDQIPGFEGLGNTPPEDPWDAAIGVSEAYSAAADAAAMALVQAAGSPRRTSLLPPTHVVVVRAERIRDTYQEMVDDIAALDPVPTGIQVISGASRSGDIESAMIHGMHGPKHVVIIIVG